MIQNHIFNKQKLINRFFVFYNIKYLLRIYSKKVLSNEKIGDYFSAKMCVQESMLEAEAEKPWIRPSSQMAPSSSG